MRIKVVVVGDGAVGKTSLLYSFYQQEPIGEYIPTLMEWCNIPIFVDNEEHILEVWDTAGQEDYDRLRPLCYGETAVFLICFSCVSPNSHFNVPARWMPELMHHCPKARHYLVCTKIDMRNDETQVQRAKDHGYNIFTREDGEKLATQINACKYFETSSETGFGIRDVFEEVCRYEKYPTLYSEPKKKCIIS